jgi:ribose transport system ATP-binding protein
LSTRGISGTVLNSLDLEVRAGEIVGVAGITGSGREELAGLLFENPERAGDVVVDGRTVPVGSPASSIANGMGLVPAERRRFAGFLDSTLRENVSIVDPSAHFRRGRIDATAERGDVGGWLARLDVRPPETEKKFGLLSGGNQQKVVIARWLRQNPRVLILDEPTQGVDIAAKADIHERIAEAAETGVAVIIASTDHEELATLCDRVLVLRNGRVAIELFTPHVDPDAITVASIGRSHTG